MQAEVLQEIGRLRSHLRPEEVLTYYFVGDYDLSSILSELPSIKYTSRQAIEISPMAGSKEQRTKLMVMNAIGNLLSRRINPKQKEVVWELEAYSPIQVKQERISQLAKEFGGWKPIVKLIENTLKGINCKNNSSKENFEDDEWIIQTYLPLIAEDFESEPITAIKNLIEVASVYGWHKFREFIAMLVDKSQHKLIEVIFYVYGLIDKSFIEEIIIDTG